ncbi:zinc-binding dehydrogenase [Niveispirillum sp. BGYR6]|uniref:zinc-binding dehydrogenase n=1 Tax=Niveispirillum sp. BGYR6 TaxID=2971249 RepID=UPI0022B9BD52|nr:zinc-binding dehydrogenase [Niveispirillum sp. BGYR6]MDG5493687.1 zinc-binding dehydrogenase [Niveispirillum sp. BGYR6]
MVTTSQVLRQSRFAPCFRDAVDLVAEPVRNPGPGEIRVRNHWCGVNGIFDTQIARNAVSYMPVSLPTYTGVEAIGVVEAVGESVTGFKVGDAAVTVRFTWGYRETATAPAAHFIRVPATNPDYLALSSTGVSALLALQHTGALRPGEVVAISAAAGGLGHLMVQIAKQRGAHVVAVCGGAQKMDFVRGLGADRVIDYKAEDVAAVLAAEYPGALDVAIDTVSGPIFDAFVDHIARHGRLVVAGAAQDLDGRPEIVTGPRIAHRIYYKGASIRGFMNGLLTDLWPQARETLFSLLDEGKIRVTFDAVRFQGLHQVPDAVEHLLSGRSMGKVVVDLRP